MDNLRRLQPLQEPIRTHRIRKLFRRESTSSAKHESYQDLLCTCSHGCLCTPYQFIASQGWNPFRAKLGPRPTEEIESEDIVAVVIWCVEAAQDEHSVVQNLAEYI